MKRDTSKKDYFIRRLLPIAAIICALILFDISPLGGNIRFYTKWVECKQKPLQTASAPGIAWYEESPFIGIARGSLWFCTPLEAEQAGYSASPKYYTFPHINSGNSPS